MGEVGILGLEMDAPEAGEGEEEAVGEDPSEGVRDGFLSFFLYGHAGGEGADFEYIGA